MIYTVDRMEGSVVVLEDETGRCGNYPAEQFPFPLREGDVLREEQGKYTLCPEIREERLAQNRARLEQLLRR